MHTVRGLAGDGGEQQPGGDAPDLLQAHVDAGERRLRAERHRLPVFEADQGDIVRYPAAGRAQRIGDAAGDLVAAAEDGVRVRLVGEQPPGRLAAPALAPLTEPRAAVRSCARRCERAVESGRAFPRGEEALRAGDVPDPAPSRGQQVLGELGLTLATNRRVLGHDRER